RIIRGVVRGVRDYGNRMGIPTVAGAVLFDKRFLGNPLVYCGTLGIMPREKSFKKAEAGDLIILCGAKTGRDGIHGATFSSRELDEHTVGLTSAVQIGNAIEEKKLTEAIIRARDENLFTAITDCGAGGISSAITELASERGAVVDLEKVPLKYKGLSYTEIWISESQERMVFFAGENNLDKLKKIFEEEGVDLTVVGRVEDDRKLILNYKNHCVCELDMDFIFENLPREEREACWVVREEKLNRLREKDNYGRDLTALLKRPNIACKDWILREYDHEVQGGSVVKSISGIENVAVNDSAVIRPKLSSDKCVAVGMGINPFYSDIDPYWMSALAIDEALRNLVCVGGDLKNTYMLDNFSWGSPLEPRTLGGLVRAAKACYDFAVYFGVPFISGKDSLYNEYMVGGKHISVPGTLLISAFSVIDDWQKTLTASFKQPANLIYLVGSTAAHLGASEYFRYLGFEEGMVPRVDKSSAKSIFIELSRTINRGLVESCHDLSEGGLGVSLAEMCIGSGLGASVFLSEVPLTEDMLEGEILFSESPTRFLVEVEKKNKEEFEKAMHGLPLGLIGCVAEEENVSIFNRHNKEIVKESVGVLKKAWLSAFSEFR
ncbi:MAG: phosphoribosylformylglycinamidine synthase, partial [Candidatus Omnitrophica bacterium]|nr:phosphoribosylformylglycinamidine synthase [Candidatus Omnitrophota bacterium]MBD3269293.1 phosphoribosylformylglycinamidine synthase [Candidatus Omnitrophota bacterium]